MKELTEKEKTLSFEKKGKGKMYYRLSINYSPKSIYLEEKNQGFSVKRSYLALDEKTLLSRGDDDSWNLKFDEKYQIKIEISTNRKRFHVALGIKNYFLFFFFFF